MSLANWLGGEGWNVFTEGCRAETDRLSSPLGITAPGATHLADHAYQMFAQYAHRYIFIRLPIKPRNNDHGLISPWGPQIYSNIIYHRETLMYYSLNL